MTQPAPKPGTEPATWDLVLADIRKRDRLGALKYGVRHQADNGRDHLQDAYEEALDLAVYLRAEIQRRAKNQEVRITHNGTNYELEFPRFDVSTATITYSAPEPDPLEPVFLQECRLCKELHGSMMYDLCKDCLPEREVF